MSLPIHTQERVAADLKISVHRRYGLDLSLDFINDILAGNPELLEDCRTLHVDTSNRSWFINEVSLKVGAGPWPTGASSDSQWEAFKAKLRILLPDHRQRYVEVEDRE